MADYEIPPDLLEARVAFVAAQERLPALGRNEWLGAQATCRKLAVEIQEHKWWRGVDDRKAAEKALREAATPLAAERIAADREAAEREAAERETAGG